MRDYRVYRLNKNEKLLYYLTACLCLAFLGLLFYRSLVVAALLMAAAVPFERLYRRHLQKKRMDRLREGFRDALYSISGAVAAGRQLPQAIGEAADSVALSYGEESDIAVELLHISLVYRETHSDVEELLFDFARRSNLEEIRQFAQSCSICRRCGGDMEAVSLRAAGLIIDRLDFDREVQGLISQKKTDIIMLLAMPIGILVFLNLVSFSYLAPLYSGISGRFLMTLCLGGIMAALLWSLKITDISL